MTKKQSKGQLIKNILRSASTPSRIPTMVKMVLREQGVDTPGTLTEDENIAWIKSNVTDFASIASEHSPALWAEAEQFHLQFKPVAEKIVADAECEVGYHLGGGGYYPFLYFVTRKLRPDTVVETGVATGYSSQAFLRAINLNGSGQLFSSDFPMFRLTDPEKYIGIVVDDDLRTRWNLMLDGDEVNLPKILELANEVDIFHYDSDKSYKGRAWALELVRPKLTGRSLIIMDDIQDNSFFHDYVIEMDRGEWMVFEFENKFVGFIGSLKALVSLDPV